MLREETITTDRLAEQGWKAETAKAGGQWTKQGEGESTFAIRQTRGKWCLVVDAQLPESRNISDEQPIDIYGIVRFDQVEFIAKRRQSMTFAEFRRSMPRLRREMILAQILQYRDQEVAKPVKLREQLLISAMKRLFEDLSAGNISKEEYAERVAAYDAMRGNVSFVNDQNAVRALTRVAPAEMPSGDPDENRAAANATAARLRKQREQKSGVSQ